MNKIICAGVDAHPNRDINAHREIAQQWKNANSKAEQQRIAREHGIRWSPLLNLPYFDIVRFSSIDPMHNLYLGTAKRMVEYNWLPNSELSFNAATQAGMEKLVKMTRIPNDYGRVASKIASNFSGLTANQWKNWTLIHSTFVLRDILPFEHRRCWQHFVDAVSRLTQWTITLDQATEAHNSLVAFVQQVEELYGRDAVTPNMHLHLHLFECIIDYGPIPAWWCYPYERFNG
jgi:hypothetical protein